MDRLVDFGDVGESCKLLLNPIFLAKLAIFNPLMMFIELLFCNKLIVGFGLSSSVIYISRIAAIPFLIALNSLVRFTNFIVWPSDKKVK